MLLTIAWILLTLGITAVLFALLYGLLGVRPSNSTRLMQELLLCLVIGFFASSFVVARVNAAVKGVQSGVASFFSRTYRPDRDLDPESDAPQYIAVVPGQPWYGVWQQKDGSLVQFETQWVDCIGNGFRYSVEELDNGDRHITYYGLDDLYNGVGASFQFIYSADGGTLRYLEPGTMQGAVWERPRRKASQGLPKEFWGYWTHEDGTVFSVFTYDMLQVDAFWCNGFYSGVERVKGEDGDWYSFTMNGQTYYCRAIPAAESATGQDLLQIAGEPGSAWGDLYARMPGEELQKFRTESEAYQVDPSLSDSEVLALVKKGSGTGTGVPSPSEQDAYTGEDNAASLPGDGAGTLSPAGDDAYDVPDWVGGQEWVIGTLPEEYTVTVDGKAVEASDDGESTIFFDNSSVAANSVVRVIGHELDGSYWTATILIADPADSSPLELDRNGPAMEGSCTSDGKLLTVEDPDIFTDYLLIYYQGYLQAIDEQDDRYMVYSTKENTERLQSRINGEQNKKNYYPPQSAKVSIDAPSLTCQDGKVAFNATFQAEIHGREDGSLRELENHQTVQLVWQDGMWQVDRFIFVSNEDFAAHRLADLAS